MRIVARIAVCVAAVAGTLAAIRACHPLPSLADRSVSAALTDTSATRLGRGIEPLVALHPAKAGIHGLADARDAFTVRMLLAQTAERSLDVQYYIWRGDLTGTLLLDALRAAADNQATVIGGRNVGDEYFGAAGDGALLFADLDEQRPM